MLPAQSFASISESYPAAESPNTYFKAHPEREKAFEAYKKKSLYELDEGKLACHIMNLEETNDETSSTLVEKLEGVSPDTFYKDGIATSKKTSSVALAILKVLALFLVNTVTLGLFGLLRLYIDKQQAQSLVTQNKIQKLQINHAIHMSSVNKSDLEEKYQNHINEISKQIEGQGLQDILLRQNPFASKKQELLILNELLDQEIEHIIETDETDVVQTKPQMEAHWISSRYKKNSGDLASIEGKYQDISRVVRIDGTYRQLLTKTAEGSHVNGKKTIEELLEAAFDWATSEIIRMQCDVDIRFNASSKILSDDAVEISSGVWVPKYGDNILAIYKLMIFLLIDAASLDTDCTGNESLTLNDEGLITRFSMPLKMVNERGQTTIFFRNGTDIFAPTGIEEVPMGCDPIACKRILTRLEPYLDEFKLILLECLIPESDKSLKKARALSQDSSIKELFDLAENLITDLALTIKHKYQKTVEASWEGFATCKSLEPFYKPDCPATIEIPLINWDVDDQPIIALLQRQARVVLTRTQKLLNETWGQIEEDTMLNQNVSKTLSKDASRALAQIREHFRVIHVNVQEEQGMAGCLFSALAISLFQGATSREDIRPSWIKEALVLYLSNNQEAWKEKIAEHTRLSGRSTQRGWSVEQYIQKLEGKTIQLQRGQGNLDNLDLGELELELFAEAFGIRVEVFVAGQFMGLKNGEVKAPKSYGPNTKQKILLFNAPGLSFYALHPKKDSNPTQHELNFWHRNNDQTVLFEGGWRTFTIV